MSKKKVPEAEQALHNEMRKYGCIVSGLPPEIHHIQGMKRKEWAVIPLSSGHHHPISGYEHSIHRNKDQFRKLFGHEWTLYFKVLNKVIGNLDQDYQDKIKESVKAYADSGHASKQFMDEYERVGVEV